jgi:hypothetical protein
MTAKQKSLLNEVSGRLKENIYEPYQRGVYLYGGRLKTARSMPEQIAVVNLSEHSYNPYGFFKHNDLLCIGKEDTFVSSKCLTFCDTCGGVKHED